MKQYTNESQTDKLIELGFEKPKSVIGYSYPEQSEQQQAYEASLGLDPYIATVDQIEFEYAYSIGELIEMLPKCIESGNGSDEAVLEISYDSEDFVWFCGHRWMYNRGWRLFNGDYRTCDDNELIDALYRYVVVLKEEGVI